MAVTAWGALNISNMLNAMMAERQRREAEAFKRQLDLREAARLEAEQQARQRSWEAEATQGAVTAATGERAESRQEMSFWSNLLAPSRKMVLDAISEADPDKYANGLRDYAEVLKIVPPNIAKKLPELPEYPQGARPTREAGVAFLRGLPGFENLDPRMQHMLWGLSGVFPSPGRAAAPTRPTPPLPFGYPLGLGVRMSTRVLEEPPSAPGPAGLPVPPGEQLYKTAEERLHEKREPERQLTRIQTAITRDWDFVKESYSSLAKADADRETESARIRLAANRYRYDSGDPEAIPPNAQAEAEKLKLGDMSNQQRQQLDLAYKYYGLAKERFEWQAALQNYQAQFQQWESGRDFDFDVWSAQLRALLDVARRDYEATQDAEQRRRDAFIIRQRTAQFILDLTERGENELAGRVQAELDTLLGAEQVAPPPTGVHPGPITGAGPSPPAGGGGLPWMPGTQVFPEIFRYGGPPGYGPAPPIPQRGAGGKVTYQQPYGGRLGAPPGAPGPVRVPIAPPAPKALAYDPWKDPTVAETLRRHGSLYGADRKAKRYRHGAAAAAEWLRGYLGTKGVPQPRVESVLTGLMATHFYPAAGIKRAALDPAATPPRVKTTGIVMTTSKWQEFVREMRQKKKPDFGTDSIFAFMCRHMPHGDAQRIIEATPRR